MKAARRSNLSLSRLQSPITSRWLHENYEIKDGVSLPRNCLYTHYLDFCSKTGIEPVNAASFGKIIRTTFPELKTRRLGTRGQSKYHYYGIGVRRSSLYYESTHNALNRQIVAQSLDENHLKEDYIVKRELTKAAHKPSTKSSTVPISTQILDTTGTILPDFPKCDAVNLSDEVTNDKVKTFLMMYRAHCQRILDTVIRANFLEIQHFLDHFWQGMPSHIAVIFSHDDVIELIVSCDNILYKAIGNVLIPGVLQPLPVSLTHAIQQFAKELCGWLERALLRLPEKLQSKKMTAARQFSQLLQRQTSLSHLAHAARTVLHHSESATQMSLDLKAINFFEILAQLSWINDESTTKISFMKFYKEFCKLLDEQSSIEQFAEWTVSLVNRCIVRPTEKDVGTFQTLSQTFLLNWNFITSKVIRELTLKSAQSFGSFHLLQMLLDDYILYLIESHADISEETIDSNDPNILVTANEACTISSPASSSGRGSLSPNREMDNAYNFPILSQHNNAIEYTLPEKHHNQTVFSYGGTENYNAYPNDIFPNIFNNTSYMDNTKKAKDSGFRVDLTNYEKETEFTADIDIVQRLQEKTKSLMGMNYSHNHPISYNPLSSWDNVNPYDGRYAPYHSAIVQRDAYSCV